MIRQVDLRVGKVALETAIERLRAQLVALEWEIVLSAAVRKQSSSMLLDQVVFSLNAYHSNPVLLPLGGDEVTRAIPSSCSTIRNRLAAHGLAYAEAPSEFDARLNYWRRRVGGRTLSRSGRSRSFASGVCDASHRLRATIESPIR